LPHIVADLPRTSTIRIVGVHQSKTISLTKDFERLQDNSPTNQLAVSQVADWISHGLVNSPTANFLKLWNYYTLFVH